MSTIFIAVQCFQCSTMQVKQQKKSGNKWNCAVCNEKQSVQKVFARAPMAKDVRKFVQSFNMSRKFVDEQKQVYELDAGIIDADDQFDCVGKKRRCDWSEYLEVKEDESGKNGRDCEQERGSDYFQGRIVTEFPEERTTNFKSMKNPSRSEDEEGDGLFKPVFTKRKHIAKQSNSQDENRNSEFSAASIHSSRWSKSTSQVDGKTTVKPRLKSGLIAKVTGPSKWSDYITEDDNQQTSDGGDITTQRNDISTEIGDEIVEDDIHPDFK